MESVYYCLQRVGRTVQVVAVQLHRKASAAAVVDGSVPASAYAQVCAFGHYVYQSWVAYLFQNLGCAVGGVVVHNDNVELEVRHLSQCTLHGVLYGLLPVSHGYDDRRFHFKVLLVEVWRVIVRRVYACLDGFQMRRGSLFHLHLYLAVGGVHVVKLLLSACPCVGLFLCVEKLVEVEYAALAA